MRSSMFLCDLTVVDHAYIDDHGKLIGGSFNPSFIISGEVDETEQVVVDFSTIKKDIKGLIDHKDFGFDHKLWVIDGWSHVTTEIDTPYIDYYTLKTPFNEFHVPFNAVRYIDRSDASHYSTGEIGKALEFFVAAELNKMYPDVEIHVTCINNTNRHTMAEDELGNIYTTDFRYAHGLKDSTSWGCQNIAHGHLSYIQVMNYNNNITGLLNLRDAIVELAQENIIFVKRENVVFEDEDTLGLRYESHSRGQFSANLNKTHQNIIVLDTETTIEHLVDFIADRLSDELQALVKTSGDPLLLFVSEGLSKGACVSIEKHG